MWLADVRDGTLAELHDGLTRDQLVERLIAIGAEDRGTVVGLDFAFSFPAWWCRERGWDGIGAVWTAVAADGERWLGDCTPPFWGRPGRLNPHPPDRRLRRTEADTAGAKSVFQIGGAGAVGTGSIRGMPHLARLEREGFGIWPFTPGRPLVVEIYPRVLTGPVRKSSPEERHAYVDKRFGGTQPAELLERAAGSEDAFDAAVSALVMAEHAGELAALEPDPRYALEGRIWRPGL